MTRRENDVTVPELQLRQRCAIDRRIKALADAGSDVLRIEVMPCHGVVNLRGAPADQSLVTDLQRVLGLELPLMPNRWHGDDRLVALWLGPEEWLLVARDDDAAQIEHLLREARSNDPWMSVVDVSHTYTRLLLQGSTVRDLLAKGCALDLRPEAFPPGACAQTVLAASRVLLRVLETGSFEVWVRNSFADYLADWLLDARGQLKLRMRSSPS